MKVSSEKTVNIELTEEEANMLLHFLGQGDVHGMSLELISLVASLGYCLDKELQ